MSWGTLVYLVTRVAIGLFTLGRGSFSSSLARSRKVFFDFSSLSFLANLVCTARIERLVLLALRRELSRLSRSLKRSSKASLSSLLILNNAAWPLIVTRVLSPLNISLGPIVREPPLIIVFLESLDG
jgi:hypothetical protein